MSGIGSVVARGAGRVCAPRAALGYALLAAALLACGDGGTGPARRLTASEAVVAATTDAVVDADARIVSGLDGVTAATLQARLAELSSRIATRDPAAIRAALARARDALAAAEAAGSPDQAPDRAAIGIALDAVQRLLDEN